MRVYEKVDGINVGFRFAREGRPRLVTRRLGELSPSQLADDLLGLGTWTGRHLPRLWALCGTRFVAFGEWLEARVGVAYSRLSSLLVLFDLYDSRSGRFLPVEEAEARCAEVGLPAAPCRFAGRLHSTADLWRVAPRSLYGARAVEGWVLRRGARVCKYVHPDFVPLREHELGRTFNRASDDSGYRRERLAV